MIESMDKKEIIRSRIAYLYCELHGRSPSLADRYGVGDCLEFVERRY